MKNTSKLNDFSQENENPLLNTTKFMVLEWALSQPLKLLSGVLKLAVNTPVMKKTLMNMNER